MREPELTPAAAEALRGPFAVEYHDSWPDHYHVSGQVPDQDDQESTTDDERGRHDIRRRAVELLPEMLSPVSLAHTLVLDADDRGEMDDEDRASLRGRALLTGTGEVIRGINAAAAPHELQPPASEEQSTLKADERIPSAASDRPWRKLLSTVPAAESWEPHALRASVRLPPFSFPLHSSKGAGRSFRPRTEGAKLGDEGRYSA